MSLMLYSGFLTSGSVIAYVNLTLMVDHNVRY